LAIQFSTNTALSPSVASVRLARMARHGTETSLESGCHNELQTVGHTAVD